MCLICVDLQKQKMTFMDAKRAFREMVVDMEPEHAKEVEKLILEAKKREEEQKKRDAND